MKKVINFISCTSMAIIIFLALTLIQWWVFKKIFNVPSLDNMMFVVFSAISIVVIKTNFKFHGPYSL